MHFPEEHISDCRPGRKLIPTRRVLEAVLWILNTGAQWHMLPQSYPNYKTVHRRFQAWCGDEILRRVLTDVANELRDRGVLDEEECFIDATFVMAKGGGAEIGATKRGKGMKIMAIVDRHGLNRIVAAQGIDLAVKSKKTMRIVWESIDPGFRRTAVRSQSRSPPDRRTW